MQFRSNSACIEKCTILQDESLFSECEKLDFPIYFFAGIYFTIIRVYPRLAIEYVYSKETGGKEDESAGKKQPFGWRGILERRGGRIKEIPGNCPRNAREEERGGCDGGRRGHGPKNVLGQKMFPKRGLKTSHIKNNFMGKNIFFKKKFPVKGTFKNGKKLLGFG